MPGGVTDLAQTRLRGENLNSVHCIKNEAVFSLCALLGNRQYNHKPQRDETYDYLGRVVRRTLPLGQEETFTYNQGGLKDTQTDFNGETTIFDYDEHNRLQVATYPDLTTETFTYNTVGQRKTVKDTRNGVTVYTYDPLRGRLESVENPDGTVLSYQYDFNGNRISVTAPSGTTAYTFDALNRIETVTDPDGNETGYTYALNGKQHTVSYPNGTWAEYFYDSNGRLIKLENKKSDNTVVGSYEYELDNVGNRLSVDEDNSRRLISYTYDDLHRLLTETIVVSGAPDTLTHTYTYDAVGNRESKETCEGTTCETITYQYNINNQLISETGLSQNIGYSYDSNGNTVAKYDMAQPEPPLWEYQYDFKNRMIVAEEPTQQIVEFAYNADGIRVQKSVDGIATDYLIDSNRPFAQVDMQTPVFRSS